MGERCTQYAYLGEPSPIRRSSKSVLCDRCLQEGYTLADAPATVEPKRPPVSSSAEGKDELLTVCGKSVAYSQGPILWCEGCLNRLREGGFPRVCEPWDSDPTPPEQRYEELLRAARVVSNVRITDENEIIPTLGFVGRFWEIPYLKRIRDRFTEADEGSEAWSRLKTSFLNSFDRLNALRVVDGVLVVGMVATEVTGTRNEAGVVDEIVVNVYRHSEKPEDVAKFYEQELKRAGLSCDSDGGEVRYEARDGRIRLTLRPERHQGSFPRPEIVEGMLEANRGSRANSSGYAHLLGGRERGAGFKADNLIPAVCAWYVGGRGRVNENHALKPMVAKVLNKHLLEPCGKLSLPEDSWDSSQSLWNRTKRVSQPILRVDHTLREGAKWLGRKRLDTYF